MRHSVDLSIIVIFHDMRREAERTLYSLSAEYQRGVQPQDYEVLAIENGSNVRIADCDFSRFGPNFAYHYHDTDAVSPVAAINAGLAMAKAERVAVIVDGARMASPGLVRRTFDAARLCPGAVIGALAWHLGPDDQRISILHGYDAETEDRLLEKSGWRESGYSLFDIASLDPSSAYGIKGGMPPELSYLAAPRQLLLAIGGYDERFVTPGGGYVNYDILERCLARSDKRPVLLAGEGTFHQVHGGVSSNAIDCERPDQRFAEEYRSIKGREFRPPEEALPRYYGPISQNAERFVAPLPRRIRRVAGALAARIMPRALATYRRLRQ